MYYEYSTFIRILFTIFVVSLYNVFGEKALERSTVTGKLDLRRKFCQFFQMFRNKENTIEINLLHLLVMPQLNGTWQNKSFTKTRQHAVPMSSNILSNFFSIFVTITRIVFYLSVCLIWT